MGGKLWQTPCVGSVALLKKKTGPYFLLNMYFFKAHFGVKSVEGKI